MADEAPTEVVDEARAAAAGTRRTAAWIASLLSAIPGLAIVATLVEGAGERGYDSSDLFFGALLASLGGVTALWAFARVMTPVPLTGADLGEFEVSKIPGSEFSDYAGLENAIRLARQSVEEAGGASEISEARAKHSQAAAAYAVAEVERIDRPGANPDEVGQAKREAREMQSRASAAAGEAARDAVSKRVADEEFARTLMLRKEALLLKAAEVVRERFNFALGIGSVAIVLISIGLVLLALAPNEKIAEAAPAPTLVTITDLTEVGANLLGCSSTSTSVDAIRVGGTDDTPIVITFPNDDCPTAATLPFRAKEEEDGVVTEVKP